MIRLLFAAAIAIAVSLVGTRLLIDWLGRRRIGQPIREDGPTGHMTKAGTPTMGGVAIVAGAGLGWLVSDFFGGTYTRRGIIVIGTIGLAGLVGLIDDWLKVSRARNLGLNKRTKFGGLVVVSILFVIGVLRFTHISTTLALTRYNYPGFHMGTVGWALFAIFLILATTNAVNLTDGLDGLASGSAIFGYAAFVVIGFWGFRHQSIYGDQSYLDLAVVAASMLGACTGFLWWNAAPARIFMGDTGSLAIGAGLAGLALSTNTGLLLVLICGLNVIETVSVILQVGSYRLTGRRIFRMAPIHHHFELAGWPETTVIVRFWILAGLCTALALGIYYADFVRLGVNY
ncbi:MAG TPA: phospho-N-acetylmuramoyl-pentapeptide-transferase [Acidimicrobiales bacterium]|nr:phospho-N-acetylmuramoyl-pentapeptide-transferase [Acidimicrobiales bacterium]